MTYGAIVVQEHEAVGCDGVSAWLLGGVCLLVWKRVGHVDGLLSRKIQHGVPRSLSLIKGPYPWQPWQQSTSTPSSLSPRNTAEADKDRCRSPLRPRQWHWGAH